MNSKGKKIIIAIVILLLVAIGVCTGIYCFKQFEEKKYKGDNQVQSQAKDNTIYYDGEEYEYNYNLKNVLFMGIDNVSEITLADAPGTAGQADCIMILSIDKEAKTAQILQISRDSMTDVDIFDRNGEYYTSVNAQIATQYAYGNGMETSCLATKKTVSELLYELPIAGYISLDIAGIPVINDCVGGVTLTVPEDYTSIDPAFVKGATITLTGEQAERYVRSRDTNMTGSNNLRMQRQVQYIPALVAKFGEQVNNGEEALEEFYSTIEPYFLTDLTAEELEELTEYTWSVDQVSYVPGESVAGEEYEEFHVDDEELQKLIVKMFYKQKN